MRTRMIPFKCFLISLNGTSGLFEFSWFDESKARAFISLRLFEVTAEGNYFNA